MKAAVWKTPRWADLLIVSSVLIIVCLFLSRLNQPTEREKRVKCSSNLQQLGLAMLMYMQSNNGQYPPSLEILPLVEENITPAVLICPDSTDTPATGATPQALAADLQKPMHCSYIYLGKGLTGTTTTAEAVIAYEPLSNHAATEKTGMNVLYGDGHVDWVDAKDAAKLLAKVAATSRPVTFP